MVKIDAEIRLKAFDLLQELKRNNISRKKVVDEIRSKFGINITTLYQWYSGEYRPFGRKGEIVYRPKLFYILGALFGDGCLYNWKITNYYLILVGDRKFTNKYADTLTKCTGTTAKNYIDRSKNIWFVRCNNFQLYSLFRKSRENLDYLENLIKTNGKKSALLFVEGFFDAEGCVKIIKEKVRKTPKICLDITNTNFEILNLIRKLLKEHLSIETKYSIQKPSTGKDGFKRKEVYHLRVYKKEYIRKFFENINTTKLKEEKILYVQNWLNNGK